MENTNIDGMENIYIVGVILKRKFEDYSEVEIVGTLGSHTIIKDAMGRHFILTDKLPEFFDIVKKKEGV